MYADLEAGGFLFPSLQICLHDKQLLVVLAVFSAITSLMFLYQNVYENVCLIESMEVKWKSDRRPLFIN